MNKSAFVFVSIFTLIILFANVSFAVEKEPVSNVSNVSSDKWYVISADSTNLLKKLFKTDSLLLGAYKVESVSVLKDKIKFCLKAESTDCALLLHPDMQKKGDVTAGAFVLRVESKNPDKQLMQAFIKGAKRIPASIWVQVKIENPDSSGSTEGWTVAMWYLLAEDHPGYALRLIESLEKSLYQSSRLQLFKAMTLNQLGKFDEAEKLFAEIDKKSDVASFAVLVNGRMAAIKGNYDLSVKLVKESLTIRNMTKEDACKIPADLALFIAKKYGKDKGSELWPKLITAFPKCQNIVEDFSRQLLDWGRNDQALEVINKALKTDGKDVELLLIKMAIVRRMKHKMEALALLNQINEIEPNRDMVISLHTNIASSLEDLDSYMPKMLERAAKDMNDLFAVHAAGVMSYYAGDYKTAKRYMDSLKTKLPDNPRVHIYASMSRYQMGDWQGALDGMDVLYKIGTNDPDVYYCYAMIWSTKDTEIARKNLEQYLVIPHHPDAVPAKQQRAWKEWKILSEGKTPPEWLPGGHESGGDDSHQDRSPNSESIPFPIVLLVLGVAVLSLFVGYKFGKKK